MRETPSIDTVEHHPYELIVRKLPREQKSCDLSRVPQTVCVKSDLNPDR